MLNLRPYNGGPDVEFFELILQFSHHLYFPLFIIKTPCRFFFFFLTPQQGTPHQGSNLCPLQWKHRALITREFPRLYFLNNFHHFIYLFIFLAVLSLCCCTSFSLVVVSGGCSPDVVCRFLIVVGGFSLLWSTGPRHMGFSSCGRLAQLFSGVWIFLHQRLNQCPLRAKADS